MNNNPKNKKADRQSLYVTVIVILMMVAVVVAIATSLSRNTAVAPAEDTSGEVSQSDTSKKDKETKNDTSKDTDDVFLSGQKESDTSASSKAEDEKESSKAEEDKKTDNFEDNKVSVNADNVLPVFVAPVTGEMLKGCSLTAPVFSNTMEDFRTHTGVDLFCESGSDVACVADGVVKEVWDDAMMGTCISVEHSGGVVSYYKNLYDEIPEGIEPGVTVNKGQIIATAGDTALLEIAEESHLHFELAVNGTTVDPCEYIEFASTPVFDE